MESFPDLGEDVSCCEERGGDVGLLWELCGGCLGQRGG